MTPLTQLIKGRSLYSIEKLTGVSRVQLARLANAGALVDDNGDVWRRTTANVKNALRKR